MSSVLEGHARTNPLFVCSKEAKKIVDKEAMALKRTIDSVNPVTVIKKHVRDPLRSFIDEKVSSYKKRTNEGINSVREVLYKSGIAAVFASAVLWVSVFLYVVFYYTYMPNITHMRPVHLQFKSCDELPGVCSFPSAHVRLTRVQRVLMVGQPYRIRLTLDMPESQVNKDLGMFMVCAQLRSRGGTLVSSSCRSTMLRHRSPIHTLMRTIFLAPLLLTNLDEEKQQLQVELFSDFEDDQSVPITDAYVELQTRHAQLYAASLHLEAHFTGLRYLMFNWPYVSAALGICTNLFFVALIFLLSWYHLQESSFFGFVKNPSDLMESDEDTKPFTGKIKFEDEDSDFAQMPLDDSGTVQDDMKKAMSSSALL